MSFSRRSFLATTAAFAGWSRLAYAQTPAAVGAAPLPGYRNEVKGYGDLVKDPHGVFDLPEGFSYRIISQMGETMDDGFVVPDNADGMGCFGLGGSRVALVRNHELKPSDSNRGPYGISQRLAARADLKKAYDLKADGVPCPGGTTTMVYDLKSRRLVSQHLSLIGTAVNCAGGATPWGSWLTCEERVIKAGDGVGKDHGWVFEVPAGDKGLVEAVPIKAMGRFQHEAACVDPRTGVVYLTEDSFDGAGLFYRFLPNDRRNLHKGGRLQAMGLRDAPEGGDTRNWKGNVTWRTGDWKEVFWIDLDGVESPEEDLRLRGHAKGAAWIARGEGIHFGVGEMYFTATSGGAPGNGQILRYVPSPLEGQAGEKDQPGRLQLFLESAEERVYDFGDNLTVAPWGHLIVCEDRYSDVDRNHLKGVTPEGKVYTIGRNVYSGNAELAGICFSPDGRSAFVNIYQPGMTLEITGPWDRFDATAT
jgi:hypothetical protein